MGVTSVFLLALAALATATASIGDNTIGDTERRISVEPVLAPPKDSRAHATDRSRQFPILILLSQRAPSNYKAEPSAKSLEGSPIYVKTLDDQAKEQGTLNRQKRTLKHKYKGGYGGGGHHGGYQQPYHGGGCGGGCGGGGHQGSFSSSSASASSSSFGWGKK